LLANIAIGSNIGDPAANVRAATGHLSRLGKLVVSSSLYATKPWGVVDQPDFCNAVVQIDCDLPAHDLLSGLQAIEKEMGRQETYRWGPRLIDLDLLTYGSLVFNDDLLQLPHPHMNERAFVLVPLAEIDRRFETVRDLLPEADLQAVALMDNQPVGPA